MVTVNPIFYIKLGEKNRVNVYIRESDGVYHSLPAYEYFTVKKTINKKDSFEIKFYDIGDKEKSYLKRNERIFFFANSNKLMKGVIRKISYLSNYECVVSGFCESALLLDKEFIKDNNDRIEYSNESAQTIVKEILSKNSDGNSPWDIEPSSEGIFDTDFDNIDIRFEHSNKLQALTNLANTIGYEWWIENKDDEYDYDTPVFYMSPYIPSTTRATTSQGSFITGGSNENCTNVEKETDTDNLANKIVILGYGDGDNQLRIEMYNSSPIYSTLSSSITSSSNTITLKDASDFPSSGEVIIGNERITYTDKLGDELTGCTRGENNTTAMAHKKGVYVQKYVETSSAEENSSINTYGVIRDTLIDKSLKNKQTMELIASNELLNRMEPLVKYKFTPADPLESASTYKLGDLVTITDKFSGTSGDFRIQEITYNSDYGLFSLEYTCSNKNEKFMDKMGDNQDKTDTNASNAQGNADVMTFSDMINSNNTASLKLKGHIPSSHIVDSDGLNTRVKSFVLDYDVDEFRSTAGSATEDDMAPGLSEGSTDNHKHDVDDSGHEHPGGSTDNHKHDAEDGGHTHTTDSTVSGATSPEEQATESSDYNYSYGIGESWTDINCFSDSNLTDYPFAMFWVTFKNDGSSTEVLKLRVQKRSQCGSTYSVYEEYPSSSGFAYNVQPGDTATFVVIIPNPSPALALQGSCTSGTFDYLDLGQGYQGFGRHTHDIDVGGTDTDYASISETDKNPALNVNSDSALISENNKSPNLTGNAESHNHNVSIGDNISDAGVINASQVSIYVDWYDADAGSWTNKHSILDTGKTLDTDVDISNGGTLPDAGGLWRVRI
ncbi:MAG: phage tail protein, partial [bacterium]